MPVTFRTLLAAFACASSTLATNAHEFWIDPEQYQVASGEPIVADIRVGEDFEGSAYSYFPQNFRMFDISHGGELRPVEARLGDRPAVNQDASDGLAVIVHVTRNYRLSYKELAKFERFVRHKDAAWTLDAHAERGLPNADFGEAYSRYAKSLVAVGDGEGSDMQFGLLTEIVAGLNPYVDDVSRGMPVTVLYEGRPRSETQVEVFEKSPDGKVEISTVTTDTDGAAIIPVKPGHSYMVDSVVLREPSEELAREENVVWESLWANLTFAVPEE